MYMCVYVYFILIHSVLILTFIINPFLRIPRISQPPPTHKSIILWPQVYQYNSAKKEKCKTELRKSLEKQRNTERKGKNNGDEKPDKFGNTFRMNIEIDRVDTPQEGNNYYYYYYYYCCCCCCCYCCCCYCYPPGVYQYCLHHFAYGMYSRLAGFSSPLFFPFTFLFLSLLCFLSIF